MVIYSNFWTIIVYLLLTDKCYLISLDLDKKNERFRRWVKSK